MLLVGWLSSKLRDVIQGLHHQIGHGMTKASDPSNLVKTNECVTVSASARFALRMTPARFEHVSKPLHTDQSQKPSLPALDKG